jgi:UTP--glucose-1-phosphate uridylyltransferase
MNISKAVVTAASRSQRALPLQTLIDRDGATKSVLQIIINEAVRAGVEEICIVVCAGDEASYRAVAGEHNVKLHFVAQQEPRGYGHALYCARDFVGGDAFLHMVGDHIYVSASDTGCAQALVELAKEQDCAISGVQPTRENLLPYFGAVGGQRVRGTKNLYTVDRVLEKPTPTQAEQELMVPGLRNGHYLCFFGMHVLTPKVMQLLEQRISQQALAPHEKLQLSPVLNELARHERYLALESQGRRYPVDARYGLLTAQLALALSGQDRDEVLTTLCEMLAQRELPA